MTPAYIWEPHTRTGKGGSLVKWDDQQPRPYIQLRLADGEILALHGTMFGPGGLATRAIVYMAPEDSAADVAAALEAR